MIRNQLVIALTSFCFPLCGRLPNKEHAAIVEAIEQRDATGLAMQCIGTSVFAGAQGHDGRTDCNQNHGSVAVKKRPAAKRKSLHRRCWWKRELLRLPRVQPDSRVGRIRSVAELIRSCYRVECVHDHRRNCELLCTRRCLRQACLSTESPLVGCQGNYSIAHDIAQDEEQGQESGFGSCLPASQERDHENAGYWYKRAPSHPADGFQRSEESRKS